MDEYMMRLCGNDWKFCDGCCDTCMTGLRRASDRTEEIPFKTEQAYKLVYEQGLKDAVKHGRWELVTTKYLAARYARVGYCQNCNKERLFDNYCPNCGAKMDLEETR